MVAVEAEVVSGTGVAEVVSAAVVAAEEDSVIEVAEEDSVAEEVVSRCLQLPGLPVETFVNMNRVHHLFLK